MKFDRRRTAETPVHAGRLQPDWAISETWDEKPSPAHGTPSQLALYDGHTCNSAFHTRLADQALSQQRAGSAAAGAVAETLYGRRQLRQTLLPLSPFCPGAPSTTVWFLSIAPGPCGPGGPGRPISPFCPRCPYPVLPFMPGNPGGPDTPCTCHQSQASIQTKMHFWLAIKMVDQTTYYFHHLTKKREKSLKTLVLRVY